VSAYRAFRRHAIPSIVGLLVVVACPSGGGGASIVPAADFATLALKFRR